MLRVFATMCMLLFLTSFASASNKQTLIVTNSKAWKPFSYINEEGEPAGILDKDVSNASQQNHQYGQRQ